MSLLARENGDRGEARVRKKKAGPRFHRKIWRNKWSWGRQSEFPTGTREISGCDVLEPSGARAQEMGGFWYAIGLSCFSEFLKGQPTLKIHDS